MNVPEGLRKLKNTGEYGTIMISLRSFICKLANYTIEDFLEYRLNVKYPNIKNIINTLYLYETNPDIRTELYKILNTP